MQRALPYAGSGDRNTVYTRTVAINAPQLACAILSYRDEPFLVEAVRSVLDQEIAIEVIVVNSGGGKVVEKLQAAGLDVPVHNVEERLYPGAVRNIGVEQTRAPYVAFLAADCLAEPGWATARLREHRAGAAAVASVLTNAYPASLTAWASLLLLHNRRLAVTKPRQQLHYSLSYERSLFERFGRFREDLRVGEDTEFNQRFGQHAPTVLALDAVTAHRYPTNFRMLLRDAFRRGRLQARTHGAIEGRRPNRLLVALRGPRSMQQSLIVTGRSPWPQRFTLLQAWPLAVAGALAYSLGALTANVTSPSR
jgi:glycosyltransferase involved in cell wall biosynthesis